jgi:DNA-binding XRE family transcriptional regulator
VAKINKNSIYGYLAVYIFPYSRIFVFVKLKRKRRPPNKKFRKALGKRIQKLRNGIKISQSQLGFETGVHRDQIGRIERGVQSPSVDTLEAMSVVFEMKLKDLLDFKY